MEKRSSSPVQNNGFRTGGDAPPSPPVLQFHMSALALVTATAKASQRKGDAELLYLPFLTESILACTNFFIANKMEKNLIKRKQFEAF